MVTWTVELTDYVGLLSAGIWKFDLLSNCNQCIVSVSCVCRLLNMVLFLLFFISVVCDVFMDVIAMLRYSQAYNQIRENIQQADAAADLKWWSANRGPEMNVLWPSFEVCGTFVSL